MRNPFETEKSGTSIVARTYDAQHGRGVSLSFFGALREELSRSFRN